MLGHQSSLLKYVVISERSLVSTIDKEKIKVKWLGSEKTTNRINVPRCKNYSSRACLWP